MTPASSPKFQPILESLEIMSQQNDLKTAVMAAWEEETGLVIGIDPARWAQYACLTVGSLMDMGFTYAPFNHFFGIDGQPRVSYTGNVWLTMAGFVDGVEVILHVITDLGSHALAEYELLRFYSLVKERLCLEPLDLFRKMICPVF